MKTNELLLAATIAVSFATATFVQAASSDSVNQNSVRPALNDNGMKNNGTDKGYYDPSRDGYNDKSYNSDQNRYGKLRYRDDSARTDAAYYNDDMENKVGYSPTCHGITASPRVQEGMKETSWRDFRSF